MTDNGTTFTSDKFKEFLSRNGIKQTFSAPYHPSSNDLAERAVKTMKQGLQEIANGTVQEKFLFKYRITPHSTTGVPLVKC